jgi:EmrB/QacA subfamily drug resistance transporter
LKVSQKVAVSVVFVAAMFISIVDITIVNVALPTIGRDFHVAPTSVGSISIGFVVSLAVFIPASGWLGDRFGGKRVLLAAIFVFTLASALCGLANSLDELVAFRILQGVGGGMLAPVGMAMLFRVFPPHERLRASSILSIPTLLAPALGPILGGVLVTNLSWRWVFYVNVPVGVIALVFGLAFLDSDPQKEPGRFDLTGFVMAGAGLGLVMYGLSEGPSKGWSSAAVLLTLIGGIVLLVAMTLIELRTPDPIIALRLLSNRLFRSATAVMVLMSVSFFGVLYGISLYYQDGRGLSALGSGLSTFPEAIGVMFGAQLASRYVYKRIGPRRTISMGLTGTALSIGLMSLLGAETNLWFARLLLFTLGLSMAHVFVPSQTISFATISPADTGRASTLFNTLRQVGSAAGVAFLTTAIVSVGATHQVNGVTTANFAAYHAAFLVATVFVVLALIVAQTVHDADAAQTMKNPEDLKIAAEQGDPVAVVTTLASDQ